LHLAKVFLVEIEPDLISTRSKEALAKHKADRVKLVRPMEPSKNLRPDPLVKKKDKRSIVKLLDVSPNTPYAW
jgi:hypothetical protein